MKAAISPDRRQVLLENFLFLFILAQPVFDLLSYLYLKGFLSVPISTVAKPVLMGLLNLALLLLYKKNIWRCAIPYGLYLILISVHVLLTDRLQIDRSFILTNIRTSISLLYFLICCFNLQILYRNTSDKNRFFHTLVKVLFLAFAIHFFLYFLSVFTGTAAKTYEYADPKKLGFKGWLDSGQVLAHGLCICLPLILQQLLHNKLSKKWLRILCKFSILIPIIVLFMIGTKVAYYIPIIVLLAQTVLELFFAIRTKEKEYRWNTLLCAVLAAICILVYPVTPVCNNTYWNEHTLAEASNSPRMVAVATSTRNTHITFGEEDTRWTEHAFSVLQEKYDSGELHPGDSRNQQFTFNWSKFKLADWSYKLFGIGHWNQQSMAMERDVMAVFFGYGIAFFLLILTMPVLRWAQAAFAILKNLLRADLTTLCLFEGFSMAFFISWYAGSTFIYPQFTFFLAVIMCLTHHKVRELKAQNGKLPA